jgi:hypothetical protein
MLGTIMVKAPNVWIFTHNACPHLCIYNRGFDGVNIVYVPDLVVGCIECANNHVFCNCVLCKVRTKKP